VALLAELTASGRSSPASEHLAVKAAYHSSELTTAADGDPDAVTVSAG
jgi:hypothetical protein